MGESIEYFKIAFCENAKGKKGFKMEFVINYSKAMCTYKDYQHCIDVISSIQYSDFLDEEDYVVIHRLIVEIYGKRNYWDYNDVLQHLKVMYRYRSNTDIDGTMCCLI